MVNIGELNTGDLSEINIADEIINNYPIQRETEEFFEPNLDLFAASDYIRPKITEQLIEIICQNKLMVLGGRLDIDKSAFMRYLALRLSEEQCQKSSPNSYENRLHILEWDGSSSDLQKVEAKLLKVSQSTIFILPKVSPQDVRYDLSSIRNAAYAKNHFVIISTDYPLSSWKLSDADQVYWQELPPELYRIEDLETALGRAIDDILSGFSEPSRLFLSNLKTRKIAEQLGTPDNISIFAKLLGNEKEPLQQPRIDELVKDTSNKGSTLKRWFHTLEPREQLLALGLSFFEDIFDDQFFAAMEHIVERAWHRRESSLDGLDYSDLDKLRSFFDFIQTEDEDIKIVSRIPGQRRILFEIAWYSHRRQILKALPIIAQIAANSVASRSNDPELYGTLERRDQLRKAISEALSDLGLISQRSVIRILLRLAADDDLGVQIVAARAIARWHEDEKNGELVKTLKKWQVSAKVSEAVSEISVDHIQALISLVVSYLAMYDPHNRLDPDLCELLDNLAKNQSRLARRNFSTHTLPILVTRHFKQLVDNGKLEDMTQDVNLIPEIAKCIALAYKYNAEDVKYTLNEWYRRSKSLEKPRMKSNEPHQREKLLATVVLAYGNIKYDDLVYIYNNENKTGLITEEEAFNRMLEILSNEDHPFVHEKTVIAISHMLIYNFNKFEPFLQSNMIKIPDKDSVELIKILKDIYLKQRREQKIIKYYILVDGRKYHISIDSERELTDVEKAMHRWLKSPEYPASQQIAVRALIAFANALDLIEAEHIRKIQEQRKQILIEAPSQDLGIASPLPVSIQAIQINKFLENIAVWLATFKEERYRLIIKGLLPEILNQFKSNKQAMTFVLEEWRQNADDDLQKIARLLDQAIRFIENRSLIAILPALGLIALLFIWQVSNTMLMVLILCALAFGLFSMKLNQEQKKEYIKNLSIKIKQILDEVRDKIKGKIQNGKT
jgi:hypothetical protein